MATMSAAERKRRAKELEEATATQSVKLNARSTRGRRGTNLDGEEAEADEQFWGQDAWKEDESDYSTEKEEKDMFDSDFDESEGEEGGDSEADEKAVRRAERLDTQRENARAAVYKEPAKKKRGRPSKAELLERATPTVDTSKESQATGAVPPPSPRKTVPPASPEKIIKKPAPVAISKAQKGPSSPGTQKRNVRASTKKKTRTAQVKRDKESTIAAHVNEQKSAAAPVPKCTIKQEDLLAEAVSTEQLNANWLVQQRQLADEGKIIEHNEANRKPFSARFFSRRGCHSIVMFPQVDLMPAILQQRKQQKPEYPEPALCKITGEPAKYRDPRTGYFYADAAAFKVLRQRYKDQPRYTGFDIVPEVARSGTPVPQQAQAPKSQVAKAAAAGVEKVTKAGRPKQKTGPKPGKRGSKGKEKDQVQQKDVYVSREQPLTQPKQPVNTQPVSSTPATSIYAPAAVSPAVVSSSGVVPIVVENASSLGASSGVSVSRGPIFTQQSVVVQAGQYAGASSSNPAPVYTQVQTGYPQQPANQQWMSNQGPGQTQTYTQQQPPVQQNVYQNQMQAGHIQVSNQPHMQHMTNAYSVEVVGSNTSIASVSSSAVPPVVANTRGDYMQIDIVGASTGTRAQM